jgi:hypothetical protein
LTVNHNESLFISVAVEINVFYRAKISIVHFIALLLMSLAQDKITIGHGEEFMLSGTKRTVIEILEIHFPNARSCVCSFAVFLLFDCAESFSANAKIIKNKQKAILDSFIFLLWF